MKPAELLRDLVAIPSVSHLSNESIIGYIASYVSGLGWHYKAYSYVDLQGVEKHNLISSPTPLDDEWAEAELAIVCHTDTVPFGNWQEATTLREMDGSLYGCGACDVKGFMACMLAAAALVQMSRLSKGLCMVFTSDEEVGCKGARFLCEQKVLQAKYAIVGEPTSLIPARAGKGYCLAEVRVTGKAAHSAYPQQCSSAIMAASWLLQEIEKLSKQLEAERNEAFSPAWTTINVGTIQGGTAKNVVPEYCSFLVEWRPIPNQPAELVYERLQRLAHGSTAKDIRVEVELLRLDYGFETGAESEVIKALCKGHSTSQAISFGTEAPWLALMGAEAVVFGPGSMLTAHSSRECVPMQELDDCVSILNAAIESLCG